MVGVCEVVCVVSMVLSLLEIFFSVVLMLLMLELMLLMLVSWENCVICVSIFLLLIGLNGFWMDICVVSRWRKFVWLSVVKLVLVWVFVWLVLGVLVML